MKNKKSRYRGRPPRDKYFGGVDFASLEYINRISIKHDLALDMMFNCFVEALDDQESKCGSLSIECREKTRDYAIFLVTKDSNVVAQFPISSYVLKDTNLLRNFISGKKLSPKKIAMVNIENPSIGELKKGMKGINLIGRITEVSKSNTVFGRFGAPKKVANAVLRDKTGVIQFPLWDQQIQVVGPGDLVQIENAYVGYFRGKLQLRIRKRDQLKVIERNLGIDP